MFEDVTSLYNRVSDSMENKNWLKYRDSIYLNDLINKGGFIVGCYVNDTLVASAFCEQPSGDYLNNLYEIGLCEDEINDTYVSGYVMVDPLYRGNSLHKILLETRIEESINRGKKNILTAVAVDNIFSLKTILNLGFEVRLQKENEYGIKRNILFKQLTLVQEKIECTA
jgi:GNAT superfamily N-acetyltransferase